MTAMHLKHAHIIERACADPESFFRGGPDLRTFFQLMSGSKYHKIRSSSARQRNAIRRRADDGPTLNAGLVGS